MKAVMMMTMLMHETYAREHEATEADSPIEWAFETSLKLNFAFQRCSTPGGDRSCLSHEFIISMSLYMFKSKCRCNCNRSYAFYQ